jgi:hypothetical protein
MHATWIRKLLVASVLISLLVPAASLILPFGTNQLVAAEPSGDTGKLEGAAASDRAKSPSDWERLIYLPYRDLEDVFEKHGSAVFMPYQEALELWRQAGQSVTDPKEDPIDAVITQSAYVASIDQDVVRIQAELAVRVLGKPWAEIPVRFGSAAVASIKAADGTVLLRGTGNGAYSLLFPSRGKYTVQIELASQVRTSPDGKSFEFDCPTVGVTTLEVIIPEADQTVTIVPRGVTLPTESEENQTRVRANLGSSGKIACNWHPRVSDRPDMELLAAVTNHSIVSVQDGLIHTHARLGYEVLRGKMDLAKVVLPLGHRILGVTSSDAKIRSWKAEAEQKRQVVTVEFLGSVEAKAVLEIHSERSSDGAAFDVAGITEDGTVHGIHAVEVVRENGQVVVAHATDLSLAVEQQRGVIRIDAAEVAAVVKRSNALSYKFYSPQFQLKMVARPVEPRIQVDHPTRLVFSDDELRLKADLNYTVERAGVFELKLQVPDDLTIDNVSTKGLKEFNVDDASKTLTVSLTAKRQGSVQVTVTGHRGLNAETPESDQTLPILEPLVVERETGHITVYAPEALELISDEEKIVAAQPEPPRKVERVPNVRLTASWSYSRRPVTIPVKTIRRPTRLSAKVATAITAKPELATVVTQLEYLVEYAGVDTFRFSVPEPVADDVQIRSASGSNAPAIKQKTKDEEAVDGWVTWTVVMQRDVLGQQKFEVSYDLKPKTEDAPADAAQESDDASSEKKDDGDTAGATRDYAVQAIRALGLSADAKRTGEVTLSQVSGEIAVLKDRALSVTASPLGDEFEAIDVRELTLLPQTGSLAYRYFKQPVGLAVISTRHEIQKVVDTVVSRALVEVVINQDQLATYRCRFRLKSSERQRLRLDLPAAVDLLGLSVDRRQVSPEKATEDSQDESWDSFLVNVARTKSSDELFWITVQFQMGLSAAFEAASGPLDLPLPSVGGIDGSQVASQEVRVVLWVPEEFALVGTPDEFVHSTRSQFLFAGMAPSSLNQKRIDSWIGGETGGVFDFPTAGQAYQYRNLGGADRLELVWWSIPTHTLLLSGALVLIAVVLRKTSWENKLGLLLIGISAAALYALEDADLVAQGIAASQYGLATLIGIWVIHAVLGAKPGAKTTTPSGPIQADAAVSEAAEQPKVESDESPTDSKDADSVQEPRPDESSTAETGDSESSDATTEPSKD